MTSRNKPRFVTLSNTRCSFVIFSKFQFQVDDFCSDRRAGSCYCYNTHTHTSVPLKPGQRLSRFLTDLFPHWKIFGKINTNTHARDRHGD